MYTCPILAKEPGIPTHRCRHLASIGLLNVKILNLRMGLLWRLKVAFTLPAAQSTLFNAIVQNGKAASANFPFCTTAVTPCGF
eukprot:1158880-Pelagomonas_calceolata.AAC.2